MMALLDQIKKLREDGRQIDWRTREAAERELRWLLFGCRDEFIALVEALAAVKRHAESEPPGYEEILHDAWDQQTVKVNEAMDAALRPFLEDPLDIARARMDAHAVKHHKFFGP